MPGLFGALKAATAAPMVVAPPAAPQRRGLFGRLGQITPDALMTFGAALQEAGGQQGAIGDLQDRRQRTRLLDAQNAWQSEQQQRQRGEWAASDAQTQALQQWVATLPPEQQAAARANPSGAIAAFMASQQQANAPITPYQRESLDLTRRGQDVSAANARRAATGADAGQYRDAAPQVCGARHQKRAR